MSKVIVTIHGSATVKVTVRAKKKPPSNGVVLWEGASLLDGAPVVVLCTGIRTKSDNIKTGGLLQTWILRIDIDPIAAIKRGLDKSICGDCIHASIPADNGAFKLGSCYVNQGQAPLQCWRTYKDGRYPRYNPIRHKRLFRGKILRIGSYGDPAAVPLGVWTRFANLTESHRGYTHQWERCEQGLSAFCMASVETAEQANRATAMGWRTFRTMLPEQQLLPNEFACPASKEAGKRKTCEDCRACSGSLDSATAHNPAIVFHGSPTGGNWKEKVFREQLQRRHPLGMV